MKYLIPISVLSSLSTFVYPNENCSEKVSRIDSLMRQHIIQGGRHPVHSFPLYSKNYSSGCETRKGNWQTF